jgi:chromosome segregation ATPase
LKRNHQTELNELKLTWRPLEQFQTLEQQLDDSEVAARQLRQQHDTDAGTIRQLREQSKEKSEIIESLQAELDANKNASKLTNKNLSRKDLLLQQTKTKLQQIEEQHEQVCSTLAATQEKLKQTQ